MSDVVITLRPNSSQLLFLLRLQYKLTVYTEECFFLSFFSGIATKGYGFGVSFVF